MIKGLLVHQGAAAQPAAISERASESCESNQRLFMLHGVWSILLSLFGERVYEAAAGSREPAESAEESEVLRGECHAPRRPLVMEQEQVRDTPNFLREQLEGRRTQLTN